MYDNSVLKLMRIQEIITDPTYEAEDYVRQFSPEDEGDFGDYQLEQDEDDEISEEHEVDYSVFLQTFIYNQSRQPKKRDIIFYYDHDKKDFVSVRVLSK